MRFVAVKGRKTGRNDERFIVVDGVAQLWVVSIGGSGVGDFEMEFNIILVSAKAVSVAEVGLHRWIDETDTVTFTTFSLV
jgi:hypothetical protein